MEPFIRTDFKVVDKRDEIASVMGYLTGKSGDVPIVTDRERPFGVLNEKGLVRSRVSPTQKIDRYVVGTKVLPQDVTPEEALDVLSTSRLAHAPVVDGDNRVVGVVHALDLLFSLESDKTAAELLHETPHLRRDTSVGEAMHHLQSVGVSVLPVVRDDGRLDGVLRRRDVMPLATDARPSGRKPGGGEVDDPRQSAIEGYVDGRFTELPPNASFEDVRNAMKETSAVVVKDPETGKPRGVLTPEGVVARLGGIGR